MVLYSCVETNVIIEELYDGIAAGFCITEKFDYVYHKELPRFERVPKVKPYGIPQGDKPRKQYLGIGNRSHEKVPQKHDFFLCSCLKTESEVMGIKGTLFGDMHCEVIWFRIYGADAIIPYGYVSCGYDITCPPEFDGAFSIINDCMFICQWHGCDDEGIAFRDYFERLNSNGLFDDVETAISYMKCYLGFEWSERGEFCICEVFRKDC